MKMYQKFISKIYLKSFFLIFISLESFFIGIDLLQNLKKIANSANLQILYTVNQLLYYMNFTLPLALIFAILLTLFKILRSNELVSLYSLGVSKHEFIKPILLISTGITFLYIGLNCSQDFVHAYEKAQNIKKYNRPYSTTTQLFLKSKNIYAYIDKLLPAKKEGKNLTIFITKNGKLTQILKSKNAIFTDNKWKLKDVKSVKIEELNTTSSKKRLIFQNFINKDVLQGFRPKIMDTLFQRLSKLTIPESIYAISFLKKEKLNHNKIRSNLYTMLIFPFFAPIVLYGIFFPFPIQRRGTNIAILNTIYIFGILIIWGLLFTFAKISTNGSISPELAIILPIILLAIISFYLSKKYKVKHI